MCDTSDSHCDPKPSKTKGRIANVITNTFLLGLLDLDSKLSWEIFRYTDLMKSYWQFRIVATLIFNS